MNRGSFKKGHIFSNSWGLFSILPPCCFPSTQFLLTGAARLVCMVVLHRCLTATEALLNGVNRSSSCLCGFPSWLWFPPTDRSFPRRSFECCGHRNKSQKSPETSCLFQACTQKHGLPQKLPGPAGFQSLPHLSCLSLSDSVQTETHQRRSQTRPGKLSEPCLRSPDRFRQGQQLRGPRRPRHNRWQADNPQRSLSSILKSPVNQSASFSSWLSCLLTDSTVTEENRRK